MQATRPPAPSSHPETTMSSTLLPANEGAADRVIRAVAGLAVLSLAFVGPKTPLGFFGLIPLVTAALGSCPLYTALGLSTCPAKPR